MSVWVNSYQIQCHDKNAGFPIHFQWDPPWYSCEGYRRFQRRFLLQTYPVSKVEPGLTFWCILAIRHQQNTAINTIWWSHNESRYVYYARNYYAKELHNPDNFRCSIAFGGNAVLPLAGIGGLQLLTRGPTSDKKSDLFTFIVMYAALIQSPSKAIF